MEFHCIIYKSFYSILIELLVSISHILFTDTERSL